MRLAFMGSPDFAVPALRALHAAGHEIAAVYCQPSETGGARLCAAAMSGSGGSGGARVTGAHASQAAD